MAISHGFGRPASSGWRAPSGYFSPFCGPLVARQSPCRSPRIQLGDGTLLFGMPLVVVAALIGALRLATVPERPGGARPPWPPSPGHGASIGVFQFVQTVLRSLQVSPDLSRRGAQSRLCRSGPFGTLGYREPSLVFLVGDGSRHAEFRRLMAVCIPPKGGDWPDGLRRIPRSKNPSLLRLRRRARSRRPCSRGVEGFKHQWRDALSISASTGLHHERSKIIPAPVSVSSSPSETRRRTCLPHDHGDRGQPARRFDGFRIVYVDDGS